MGRRFLKVFCCFLVLAGCLLNGSLKTYGAERQTEDPGALFAESAVLMDAESGRILYEKNGGTFLANASTTKILTCILALEKGQKEDIVSVSEYAASMPDVQLHIQAGESYRLEDLLYSLMLESHNDTAVAIAEHLAGSCESFSRMMNQKAKEIGCSNTFFLTPNGLDATQTIRTADEESRTQSHGTTARDLALLMRYCIRLSPQREEFIRITGAGEHSFTNRVVNEKGEWNPGERSFLCRNHNTFLQMMEGAFSGKTGFTNQAGYCYVGALKRGDRSYIVALLACGWPYNRNYKWEDTKKLMEYGLDLYEFCPFEKAQPEWESVLKTGVDKGKSERIGEPAVVSLERIRGFEGNGVLLKEGETLSCRVEMESLTAPVKQGQKVGEVVYLLNGEEWKKDTLVCKTGIERIDFGWCLEKCLEIFIV